MAEPVPSSPELEIPPVRQYLNESLEDELLNDAPGDDRTDNALKARTDTYDRATDLDWMMQSVEEPQGEEKPKAPEKKEEKKDASASPINTAFTGSEVVRQAAGGVLDAVQSFREFADWAALKVLPGAATLKEWEESILPKVDLSEVVDPPETLAGSGVRAISQFLAPFGVATKVMGGLRAASTAGALTKAAGAGAATDFLAFDAHQERLANLIEAYPALKNPVTKYLKSDKEDSELEGRVKNAIEGIGVGTLAEGLFRGVKFVRSLRKAAKDKDPGEVAATFIKTASDEQMLREAGDLSLLGSADETVPLVIDKKITAAVQQAGELGVPDDTVARALTKKGLEPLAGTEGVYVNFARINAPEDIQRIIQDTTSAFSDDIEKARRGVRTNAETVLSADKINAWNALMSRPGGSPLNAEQSVAARQLWATAADKLSQVAEIASQTPTPENLFQFRRMMATFTAIQKEVIAARSETARALQSWAIPVGGNLERMASMTQLLDQAGGEEVAKYLAQRVAVMAKMPNGMQAMSKFSEKGVYARTLGAVQEYWLGSILSGPFTHIVNTLSNSSVLAISLAERATAARMGRAFEEEGVEVGEAAAQFGALRQHIWDAFRNAGKALRTGQTGFGVNKLELPRERYISSGAWNLRSDSWHGQAVDAIGAIANVSGRFLQAEDEFFKTLGYRMELAGLAHRQAVREVREGKIAQDAYDERIAQILNDPPEAVRLEAASEAAYRTFTSQPGDLTKKFQRLIAERTEGKFVFPFINTPANITKYFFERTPLAPITAKYRNAIAKGGADADLARTRMALGTATLMFAVDLGMQGHITGSGPGKSERAERQNMMRTGERPYSLRIGDNYVAFNRLDPMGFTLGVGADIAEWLKNSDHPTEDDLAAAQEGFAAGVFSIAENLFSKTYMRGMSMLTEAVNDPKAFGETYINQFAASFVPAAVKQVATAMDPIKRQTHDIWSAMRARIPVLSETLPAQMDLYGREIEYKSGFGKAYDVMSPLYGSTYKPEPIDEAMKKDGWFLGMGGNSTTVKGEIVSFKNRPDIRNRYYKLRGGTKPSEIGADWLSDRYGDNTMLETLNGMVTGANDLSEKWNEADNADDRKRIAQSIYDDYGRAAREQLLMEFPWIEETAMRKKALRLEGSAEQVAP